MEKLYDIEYVQDGINRMDKPIYKHTCKRCGYTWQSERTDDQVRACTRCKSYYWREPKKAINIKKED